MSREQFHELLDHLIPYISPNILSSNRRKISANKKLTINLYFLKDTGSLVMTANIFGIALSTALKNIHEVCKAITEYLGSKYTRLPRTDEEMIQKASEFESKHGMTQAFGGIGGTHVPILQPIENSHEYYCYKMFLLQLFKQFVIAGVFLWMWTTDGLVLSTKPKCSAIQKQTRIYRTKNYQ